jgi:hypothetical protein
MEIIIDHSHSNLLSSCRLEFARAADLESNTTRPFKKDFFKSLLASSVPWTLRIVGLKSQRVAPFDRLRGEHRTVSRRHLLTPTSTCYLPRVLAASNVEAWDP